MADEGVSLEHEFEFEAELWRWAARDSWIFVSLPEDLSDVIEEIHGDSARGFGSLRVQVELAGQVWRTSIFPDADAGSYVLPLKKDVRRRAGVDAGDVVTIALSVL